MNEISKAAQEAADAARQSDTYAAVLAALKASQQPEHGHSCGCQRGRPSRSRRSTGQILALTAAGCAACTVAVGMFLAVAVTAVAVSGSALVFLFVIRELRKGR